MSDSLTHFLVAFLVFGFMALFALIISLAHMLNQLKDEFARKPWVQDMDPKMVAYPLKAGASLKIGAGEITNDTDQKIFLSWKGF